MTSRWDNPTGGFGYHVRAWRFRDTRWAPFVRNVARWLSNWNPPEQSLLLLGPSGGHCLPLPWLARFTRVTAVDIDPWSPPVFRWRARHVLRARNLRLDWDARDHLSPGEQGFTLAPLRALLAEHPGAAVLFCNILGQLPILGDDRAADQRDDDPPPGSYERWLRDLPDALAGRSWATFHDRLSGSVRPRGIDGERPVAWSSAEALVRGHYPLTDDPDAGLFDHRTSGLLPEVPRWQWVWELAPETWHLIEAMDFRAPQASS